MARTTSGSTRVTLFCTGIPSARQRSMSCREVMPTSLATSLTFGPFLLTGRWYPPAYTSANGQYPPFASEPDTRNRPSSFWYNKPSKEVDKVLRRLIESSKRPGIIRVSVDGATHGWGMSMQNEIDFRLVQAWSKGTVTRDDAMRVLSKMIDRSEESAAAFEDTFRRLESQAKQSRQQGKDWAFTFPLLVKTAPDVSLPVRFRALGRTFTLRTWRSAVRSMGRKRVQSGVWGLRNKRRDVIIDVCMTVHGQGQDASEAWVAVEPAFDSLRGELELTQGYMRSMLLRFPEGPLRSIPHPPWMLAYDKADKHVEPIDFLVTEAELEPGTRFTLKQELVAAVRKNLRRFVRTPASEKDTRALIVDALRLYTQALDAPRLHQQFLGLWQCAECLTMASTYGGDGRRTSARLATLARRSNLDTSRLADVLKELYEYRNKIVHHGEHGQVDQDEVNFLKNCCELGLTWLMGRAHKIRTQPQLEWFYQFEALSPIELNALHGAVTLIRQKQQRPRARRKPK